MQRGKRRVVESSDEDEEDCAASHSLVPSPSSGTTKNPKVTTLSSLKVPKKNTFAKFANPAVATGDAEVPWMTSKPSATEIAANKRKFEERAAAEKRRRRPAAGGKRGRERDEGRAEQDDDEEGEWPSDDDEDDDGLESAGSGGEDGEGDAEWRAKAEVKQSRKDALERLRKNKKERRETGGALQQDSEHRRRRAESRREVKRASPGAKSRADESDSVKDLASAVLDLVSEEEACEEPRAATARAPVSFALQRTARGRASTSPPAASPSAQRAWRAPARGATTTEAGSKTADDCDDGGGGDDDDAGSDDDDLDAAARRASELLRACAKYSRELMAELEAHSLAGGTGSFHLAPTAMRAGTGAFAAATTADVAACCGDELSLRDHQLVGVNWLLLLERVGANGVLADDMGLGKTVQTICYLALSRRLRRKSAAARGAGCTSKGTDCDVIVVPASTLDNWKSEFARFNAGARVVAYHGSAAVRRTLRETPTLWHDCDVVLTTYTWWERDSCTEDRGFFSARGPWAHVVLDEGHCLKNPKSQRSRRLRALKAKSRTILSGTPIQNEPLDFLSLLLFLMPKLFKDGAADIAETLAALDRAGIGEGARAKSGVQQLRALLAPFVLRRVKADVLSSLPPKTYVTMRVVLDEEQRDTYVSVTARHVAAKVKAARRHARDEDAAALFAAELDEASYASGQAARHVFTELRKAANHPLLLRRRYSERDIDHLAQVCVQEAHFGEQATLSMVKAELAKSCDLDLHEICTEYPGARRLELPNEALFSSGKIVELAKLLPRLQREGHKVLLFSQWVRLLDILGLLCQDLGLNSLRLDGSTPVSERHALVNRFNGSEERVDVFLLSTRAGGLGINLVGADTVIIHDVDFNPEVDRQAEDRAHRIGQTRPVTVYRMVSDETVDDDILQIALRKREMNERVLSSADDDTRSAADATPPPSAVAAALKRALLEYQARAAPPAP